MAIINPIKSPYVNPFGNFVLPGKCASWLNMEERSDKLIDKSGNGNHGTNGGATIKTVNAGLARNFDGIDDFIQIADSAATRLTTGGTLAAWIYPKSLGEFNDGRIIDKSADVVATNGYKFAMATSNNLYFRINSGANTASAVNSITLNQWQHVTVIFGSTGRHLYVNGIDVTASGGSETALPPDVAKIVAIGNRAGVTDRTFDGYIDDTMIFTRALSQSEIKYIFKMTAWQYGIAA